MNNQPILKVEQLSMRFGGIVALENVNFSVQERTITALIGPNGAGKTTVFNCCTGIYRPSGGDVLMKLTADQEMKSMVDLCGLRIKAKDYLFVFPLLMKTAVNLFRGNYMVNRVGLARTFQNMRLFQSMTLIENLLIAQHLKVHWGLIAGVLNTKKYNQLHLEAVDRAYFWLEKLGLQEDAQKLAGDLPYGKARKLEIARAMCTDPQIICLDEPAAGLNNAETAELSQIILGLKEDFPITIFLIEHDMSLVMKISDEILVLDHGVIIAQGNADEIKNNPQVITAYLGAEN